MCSWSIAPKRSSRACFGGTGPPNCSMGTPGTMTKRGSGCMRRWRESGWEDKMSRALCPILCSQHFKFSSMCCSLRADGITETPWLTAQFSRSWAAVRPGCSCKQPPAHSTPNKALDPQPPKLGGLEGSRLRGFFTVGHTTYALGVMGVAIVGGESRLAPSPSCAAHSPPATLQRRLGLVGVTTTKPEDMHSPKPLDLL